MQNNEIEQAIQRLKETFPSLWGILRTDYFININHPSGCSDCPFAKEEREINSADPDEGYYSCSLLSKTGIWGEEPSCTSKEWKEKAMSELKTLVSLASDRSKEKAMTDSELNTQPVPVYKLFERVLKISSQIEDEMRALIIELANVDSSSEVFDEAVSALKHLEKVSSSLTDRIDHTKPAPTMAEILATANLKAIRYNLQKPED